jgi:tetratricopeptide (TPR) repeat protein
LQKITLNSAIKIIQSILKQRSNVELSNFIYTKSGGNPFYLEQITLYLKQNNMVVLEKGKYKLKDNNLTKMRIPASINEIIISRIDSLTKEVKRVIKTASVLGEKFSIRILSEMLNNENLLKKLSEGKKQKIWYPVNEIIYIFSHALIRDSVYEMQLKKTLRKLHKLAAVSIEKVYKNNLERYYQILGYHFERADMKNRAIKYFIMAAKIEKNKYHNEIAENLYLHALDLIGNKKNYEEQKLKIRLDLGLIKQRYGDLDNAINIFKNAIETSRTQKNIVGDLYNALGWIYYLKRDYDTALNLYNKAIKYFKRNNEELGLSLAYGHIAVVYLMTKQFEKSLEYFDRKKVITNKLKRNIGMVELNVNLGALYIQMENYDKALYHLLEAEKLIAKEKNILYKSAIIGNIGLIYFRQGNFHSALMYFKRDLKLCRLMGDKVKYSITLRNLALLYKKKKNYQKAIMKNMELVELFTKMKNNYGLIDAYSDLGVIYQKKREYVVAEKYSKKAISLDNPNNRRHKIDSNYYNLFLIRKKQKKYKSALNYIKKSIEMAQNIERKKNNLSLYYYEKAMLLKKIKKYDEFINNINLAYKTANENSEIKLKSNFEILLDL